MTDFTREMHSEVRETEKERRGVLTHGDKKMHINKEQDETGNDTDWFGYFIDSLQKVFSQATAAEIRYKLLGTVHGPALPDVLRCL